jgi:hypothetical protein
VGRVSGVVSTWKNQERWLISKIKSAKIFQVGQLGQVGQLFTHYFSTAFKRVCFYASRLRSSRDLTVQNCLPLQNRTFVCRRTAPIITF